MARDLPQEELAGRIEAALRSMPRTTRRVFELHRYDDKSFAEIAVELGLTARTVEKHLAAAMVRLDQVIHGRR